MLSLLLPLLYFGGHQVFFLHFYCKVRKNACQVAANNRLLGNVPNKQQTNSKKRVTEPKKSVISR